MDDRHLRHSPDPALPPQPIRRSGRRRGYHTSRCCHPEDYAKLSKVTLGQTKPNQEPSWERLARIVISMVPCRSRCALLVHATSTACLSTAENDLGHPGSGYLEQRALAHLQLRTHHHCSGRPHASAPIRSTRQGPPARERSPCGARDPPRTHTMTFGSDEDVA
jgi:hypothetical protein